MALGDSYPASFRDASGETRFYGTLQMEDSTDQPGNPLPAIVNAAALPTADPHVVGQVWRNSGVLTVSAG